MYTNAGTHTHTHTRMHAHTFIEVSYRMVVVVDLLAAKARRVLCSIADFFRFKIQMLVVTTSTTVRMNLHWLDECIAA